MKKIFTSALAIAMISSISAQNIETDTVTTGHNYSNQRYYSLSDGIKTSAADSVWNIAFGVDAFTYDAPIRFNSLIGDVRELPNADINDELHEVDTAGWDTADSRYDSDQNIFKGALSRDQADAQDVDYYWGKYSTTTHIINPTKTFGALIGSDFYMMRFKMETIPNTYTIEFCKYGDDHSTSKVIQLNDYLTKNYIYFDLKNESIKDLEPASSEWDLFFGKYYTYYQNMAMYPVAGVMNNVGTQIAKVIDNDAENYAFVGNETFSTQNNVIGYDWKQAGQNGVTMADTVVYFVKTKNGNLWKVFFTDFISGTGTSATAGSYIFNKELIMEAGVKENNKVFTQVYPNPSNESTQIVVDAEENTSIDIYSLSGQKVFTTTLESGLQTLQISTSNFENGIYHVVVSTNNSQNIVKLAVQH